MLNQCQFIGNLGKDPEIRTMQSGEKVANLSIACSEKWTDRNSGEKREKTTWVPVVIFGKLADVAERFLRKGSKVFVQGKLTVRKWQDQSGQDRYSTEIVLQGFGGTLTMLDGRDGGGADSGGSSGGYDQGYGGGGQPGGRDLEDEAPF